MKKMLSLFLFIVGMLAFCSAVADDLPGAFASGDYRYDVLEDGSVKIIKYISNGEEVAIPEELDGKKVASIGERAFFQKSLVAITIPGSITNIEEGAFAGCDRLESITIPDSVASIDGNPFLECAHLTDIIVSPDHPYLAVIDGVLFSKPDKRLVCYPCIFTDETYVIPNGIQAIADSAFYECNSLVHIMIPDSVTSIGNDAFGACSSLTDITIPDGVASIGNRAFSKCYALASITIPGSVDSIGFQAFLGCRSLASITIPDSVTDIGGEAFLNCVSLTDVIIPGSVASIGDNAFSVYQDYNMLPIPDLTLTVPRDSYAAQYCKDNNIPYAYTDALDWLNN